MIWGYVEYKVYGDSFSVLYKFITHDKIPCKKIRENKGCLYFKIPVEYKIDIESQLELLNFQYEIISRKGLIFKVKKVFGKKGMLLGAATAFFICLIFSNMIFRFNILTDNEEIKKQIMAVLKENNVSAGSFIPSLNCTVLERELKQKVADISWAGISTNGTTMIIDVLENVDKPQAAKIRLPSNLIAAHDAVIDKVELLDGQLMTTVGSAVIKGDLLVSGTVITEKVYYKDSKEIIETSTRYTRSIGAVYGTFTEEVSFKQSFETSEMNIEENALSRSYLSLFDINIPLFLKSNRGNYIEHSSESKLSIFGFELPISVIHTTLDEFSYENTILSEAEAMDCANALATNYEHNFLKNYEIINAKREERITDDGAEVICTYTLYGDICEEVEFFINK